MDISIGARVECVDGGCGHVVAVVFDPKLETITHIVVESAIGEATFFETLRLVPLEHVTTAEGGQVQLDCTQEQIGHMTSFEQTEYVETQVPDYDGHAYTWAPSLWQMGEVPIVHEAVPAGELAIHHGARVLATDGPVGWVDEFIIDAETERLSFLVLKEGHLWGKRDVSIPADQIDHIEGDEVTLKLSKAAIEGLPTMHAHPR